MRGFSPADILNVITPHGLWNKIEGLSYGTGPRHKLDIYRPRTAARAPVVVFFYGGSWQTGSRDLYHFLGAALATRGVVTVVPDYSVFPQARFPDFLGDAARAVSFVRDHAPVWGGDAGRLSVMGHSAGAYIAAMLTFDRQWLTAVGIEPRRDLAGFIGLAGPYDFLPIRDKTLQVIFGGPDRADTQPIRHVSGPTPPALLISARRDSIVSPDNTTRLAARIRANGGDVDERYYLLVGHLGLIATFAPGFRALAPILSDVTRFLTRLQPMRAP
jgi:acetyl esterase/lipase